ncbi:coiled-coil domain-containing protein 63-like [Diadema antillarum]|uniref:coiled-coil domain-containing protein 63-like n=1 Tax=Diadema antillarum TaxID=105358 RepID=UPI003A8A004B
MNALTRKQESAVIDPDELVNAEAELCQLKQRYRIVQNDRKAYLDESSNVLRKQRKYIESLLEEKDEFKMDMRLVESMTNRKRDANDLETMTMLLATCSEGNRQIEEEKSNIRACDLKLSIASDSNLTRLRVRGGWNADQVRQMTSRKKIRTMENKLDKRTVAFNKALATNCDLRDQIQQHRRELQLFNGTYQSLLTRQALLKEEMNETIEQSTAAYDNREECLTRMATLNERNEKDESHYNNTIKELKRILAHDQKLKEFMSLKTQDRSELLKAASDIAKKKQAKSNKVCLHKDEIKAYQVVFERLKQHYNDPDLDHLIRCFLDQEGVSFALFNYNSELKCDIETLTARNETLKRDIETFLEQGSLLEGERVHMMKDLEAKSSDVMSTADAVENQLKRSRKDLDIIIRAIATFVRKLGCDTSAATGRLGCRGAINDRNAMMILGLAESVCDDMILIEAFRQHINLKSTLRKKAPVGAQQGSIIAARLRPKSPVAISIKPPSIGEDGEIPADLEAIASSNMDESQPLSLHEIRRKVVTAIEKRELHHASLRNDCHSQSTNPSSRNDASAEDYHSDHADSHEELVITSGSHANTL